MNTKYELLSFIPGNDDCDFDRVAALQERMNARVPTVCPERAEIVTEVYKRTEDEPIVIRRAKAFAETLKRMTVYIEPGSLIIGNQARENFAAPVFPEYSYEWVIDELDQFDKRPGDYFNISDDTKNRLKSLRGYWKGKTLQDEIKANLSVTDILAEKQNVIHRGGISMSGDGHIIPNHAFVLKVGFGGVKKTALSRLRQTGLTQEQKDFYAAAVIAMDGAVYYCKRLARAAADAASIENDAKRKTELTGLSRMMDSFLDNGARSFHETVQAVYLLHLLMMVESNGHSFSFGRFDQYIHPYYKRDADANKLTKEKALEIITHFFIMTNSINKVRPWGHTQYSGGYPLYSNLTVGGVRLDGTDGTNELSYLCLEAMNLSRLPEPNLSVRFNENTPRSLLNNAARLIRKGFGMPSVFCDEVCIRAMRSLGIDAATASDYASMGCVEIAIPGKWGHRATGMTYINFGKLFEIVINNGMDPDSGVCLIDLTDKSGAGYGSYYALWDAWQTALAYYFDLAVKSDYVCDKALKYHDADAFASSLVDCCLERGLTLKNGGAEYDFVSQSTVGLSVVGDSLAAVKKLVFDDKVITMDALKQALSANFDGPGGARIRQMCINAPKFGNDDDYADGITAAVYESYLELLPKYKTDRAGKGPFGCGYTMSTSNITSYVPNGFDVGATPDGRLKGMPLSEGASPCLGADRKGPTAVINSISKLPNERMAGGQLLNMRFSPAAVEGDANLDRFVGFIEAGRLKSIFHNQFNIIDSETLKAAKQNPDRYPGLMVRVAGYCALFSTLTPKTQDAVIARTEHGWK